VEAPDPKMEVVHLPQLLLGLEESVKLKKLISVYSKLTCCNSKWTGKVTKYKPAACIYTDSIDHALKLKRFVRLN
jgi:hypothetical protein